MIPTDSVLFFTEEGWEQYRHHGLPRRPGQYMCFTKKAHNYVGEKSTMHMIAVDEAKTVLYTPGILAVVQSMVEIPETIILVGLSPEVESLLKSAKALDMHILTREFSH